MDIGCGRGWFVINFAKMGKIVIAVEDGRRAQVTYYLCHLLGLENVVIINSFVTSKNVQILPEVDITLFMGVYHQMYKYQGQEDAKKILQEIWNKTKKVMFFFMADERTANPKYKGEFIEFGNTSEELKQRIGDLLSSLGNNTVKCIGEFDVWENGSPRLFFKIVRII